MKTAKKPRRSRKSHGALIKAEIYPLLKQRAERNHRSVCGELNCILELVLKGVKQ